jgi:hypothetical protein
MAMPDVSLALCANVPEFRLAQLARDLQRDLNRVGVSARSIAGPTVEGERGDISLLGQLALGLVSTGAVTALIECLKAYLSRERELAIKLTRPDGMMVEITSRNIDTDAVRDALREVIPAKQQ